MNQGVVQSAPVQQMVAAGSPNWWSINNMRPPPIHHQHQYSFLTAPPHNHFPHQLAPTLFAASTWNDSQELPESWSQLILGGLVGEEDKPGLNHMLAKKLESWEQQLLVNQTSSGSGVDIKQENSGTCSCYTYGPGNVEFQSSAKPTNCWSHQIVSASSPKSCITTLSNNMLDFSPKSSHGKQDPNSSECNSTATGGAATKKARIQPSSAHPPFKVRKEKLGDRITALHQLVSPFGKTDTASVLLEAIGYIRFLQSQIEALSLPYLGSTGSGSMKQQRPVQGERNCLFPQEQKEKCIKRKGISDDHLESDEEAKKDLRSRGLCLVPISCTLDVGSENGADYWAPAFGANFQ